MVLNVNDIISKRDMVAMFLHKTQPILLMITESHVTGIDEDALIEIKGYSCIRCDSNTRHTGGVVMYVREDLS